MGVEEMRSFNIQLERVRVCFLHEFLVDLVLHLCLLATLHKLSEILTGYHKAHPVADDWEPPEYEKRD